MAWTVVLYIFQDKTERSYKLQPKSSLYILPWSCWKIKVIVRWKESISWTNWCQPLFLTWLTWPDSFHNGESHELNLLLRENLEIMLAIAYENLSRVCGLLYCRMCGASENKMMGEIPRMGHWVKLCFVVLRFFLNYSCLVGLGSLHGSIRTNQRAYWNISEPASLLIRNPPCLKNCLNLFVGLW